MRRELGSRFDIILQMYVRWSPGGWVVLDAFLNAALSASVNAYAKCRSQVN